jgi:hypothetical protein
MDLIIMVGPRGFTLGVDSVGRRSSCDVDVAIFPRMGWHADEVLSALVHDDTETIQAPLSVVLAKVAQLIATHGASEASELGEPLPRAAPSTVGMDLIIVRLPHCHALKVGSGSGREWRGRADLVAVFPGAGWCQTEVQNALSRNEWSPIQAPLSCVLAMVAQLISTHCTIDVSELDESGTEDDTVCSCCRRAREASPPPTPHPADQNVPRLTEAALAQHTRAHERDRSRSPARAANLSAEASR